MRTKEIKNPQLPEDYFDHRATYAFAEPSWAKWLRPSVRIQEVDLSVPARIVTVEDLTRAQQLLSHGVISREQLIRMLPVGSVQILPEDSDAS
jgi:hypothetical protein